VIVLKRSGPAVSHICSLIRLPSRVMVRILKSILRAGRGRASGSRRVRAKRGSVLRLAQDLIRVRQAHPIVVIKLVVNESSANRIRMADLPTPADGPQHSSCHRSRPSPMGHCVQMRLAKTRLPAAGQWPSAVLTGISDQQQLDQIVVLSIQPASSRRWHAGRPRSRTAAPGRDHEKVARAKVAGKFDVVLK
jgi:hypothetical protein